MKSGRRVLFVVIAIVAVSVVGVFAFGVPDGEWRETGENDCPANLVCAQWVWGGGSSLPCCVEPGRVSRDSYEDCGGLRHLHPGG